MVLQGSLYMGFGRARGSAAAQESRVRCEGNVEPLAAATSCRGRAVCKFGSLIASSAAGFERFWASPFPTHIAAAEGSAMPGESWGARTRVLVSCGGSCKGVRCGAARRPGTDASIAGSSH